MRFIRLILTVLLALTLIGIALANRQLVTLSVFPANFGQYLGGQWTVNLPLFLIIFLAFAAGMLAGLVWEYLRETGIRRDARKSNAQIARLESEVGNLRDTHAAPRDEVLAILERPKATPAAGTGTTLPAQR
jgi:uncharacterized integral membrane protein